MAFFDVLYYTFQFSSVQMLMFRVMSDSNTPWTAAHQASLSITNSRVYSNSCPLSQWCHPIISSFLVPFSSCLQSFPASGSFPMSQFFTSGGQSIGASRSASTSNEYSGMICFKIDWSELLAAQGTLKNSATPQCQSINSSVLSFFYDEMLPWYSNFL